MVGSLYEMTGFSIIYYDLEWVILGMISYSVTKGLVFISDCETSRDKFERFFNYNFLFFENE